MRPEDIGIKHLRGKVHKVMEILNSMRLLQCSDNPWMGMDQISEELQALEIKCLCSSAQAEQY